MYLLMFGTKGKLFPRKLEETLAIFQIFAEYFW